jgi:hypothetical protein
MKWMEVIGVRATASNRTKLEAKLHGAVAEIQKEDATRSIKILHRVSIESDLCVHLQHDSAKPDPAGSRLGLRLAAEMKSFGLVHHSVWAELPGRHA